MNRSKLQITFSSLLFIGLSGFWIYLGVENLRGDTDKAELFSAIYGAMALTGGLIGLSVSRRWGGSKSLIGKSVLFTALGLLAQALGQITYSGYTYLLNQEIPYPSFGDFWYFGSVILYILAAINLLKALNAKTALSSHKNKLLVVAIPVAMLVFSYVEFLRSYEFDFSNPLVVFLDFGYPFGQAIYVSLAFLAYIFARPYLGGLMRPVISLLLVSFVLQYLADFVFLYQVSRETWQTGGVNELMYLIAYFVMTISLIVFGTTLDKISGNKTPKEESK